jgi:hypothetical protein
MNCYFRMFGNRVPHMLESDYKPYSAIDIFVKDLVCIFVISLNFLCLFELPRICRITSPDLLLFGLQGIVCNESSKMKIPVPVSCIAHQLFLSGTVVKLHPLDNHATTSLPFFCYFYLLCPVNVYVFVLASIHIYILIFHKL